MHLEHNANKKEQAVFSSWSYLLVLLLPQWKAKTAQNWYVHGKREAQYNFPVDKIRQNKTRQIETFLQLQSSVSILPLILVALNLTARLVSLTSAKHSSKHGSVKFWESTISYTVYKFYTVNYACWATILASDVLLKMHNSKLAVYAHYKKFSNYI